MIMTADINNNKWNHFDRRKSITYTLTSINLELILYLWMFDSNSIADGFWIIGKYFMGLFPKKLRETLPSEAELIYLINGVHPMG